MYRLFLLSLATPYSLYAAGTVTSVGKNAGDGIGSLAKIIVDLLNAGSMLLITATIVFYLAGGVRKIYELGQGKSKGSDMTAYFGWGIGIVFVMVSIWGLVQFVQYTFLGGPSPANTEGVIRY
jgi:hypothetical protein